MKKLLIFLFSAVCAFATFAQDFGSDGMTFYKNGQTLDLYNNGLVVYLAKGSPVSRRGDWKKGGGRGIASRRTGRQTSDGGITVSVYVGDRTVTWTGNVNYSNGQITSITLDGETWYRR